MATEFSAFFLITLKLKSQKALSGSIEAKGVIL